MTGAAVKLIWVPGQTAAEGEADTETAGAGAGLTTIAIEFEFAITGEAQVADEVITTVTISPLVKSDEVKPAEFVPALTPLTFH